MKTIRVLTIAFLAGLGLWSARRLLQPHGERPSSLPPVPPRMDHTHQSIQAEERDANPQVIKSTEQVGSPMPPSDSLLGSISDRTRAVVDANGSHSFNERIKEARVLGTKLTNNDVTTLFWYLTRKEQDSLVKNAVINALRDQEVPPAGLAEALIAIYQDSDQDPILRNYALQHLGLWYPKAELSEKQRVHNVLMEASQEPSDLAGTALLAAQRLSQDHEEFEPGQITESALRVARDDGRGELARITGLQVCSRLGATEILPVAIRLAQNGGSVSLRLSAIAVIGDLGDAIMLRPLDALSADANPRIQTAARSALSRLRGRLRMTRNQE